MGFLLLLLVARDGFAGSNAHSVQFYSDVAIGSIDDVPLTIDIATVLATNLAANTGANTHTHTEIKPQTLRPALVVIHGGAWRKGSKESKRKTITNYASKGFVGAALMYRFAPEHSFPAAVEDVKAAIRFLKVHAGNYGIDPNKIVVVGTSAGAHLAAMLAVTGQQDSFNTHGLWDEADASIFAAVLLAGPLSGFTEQNMANNQSLALFLGGKPSENPAQAIAAMPISYVNAQAAPMFIAHGDADRVVGVQASRDFVSALVANKVRHRYMELEGAGHAIAKTHPNVYKDALAFVNELIAESNKK